MLKSFSPDSSGRVLVVGDIILDRYVHGDTTRISPEAPVPVVRVNTTEERPGGAANVALNVKSLGVEVQLIGVTGDDNAADILSGQLSKAGVICRFVRQQDFPTITKFRVLSQHQQLIRLDYESHADRIEATELFELYKQFQNGISVIVLSDYAKGSLREVDKFIDLARTEGTRVMIDPKGNDFTRYRGACLLTPNLKEFEAVAGKCSDETAIAEKGMIMCNSLELDYLLITRGEHGMTLIDKPGESVMHLSAHAHEVFDVTGAGDTVIAAMAAAVASGYPFNDAMRFANAAAGIVVEKLGAASVSVTELNSAMLAATATRTGIISADDLPALLADAHTRGEKLVMTNGCFDILHAGHVQYLQQAKLLGDRLLVAVNDDDSVRRLKGEARPVNPVAQRMAVLAGLKSVDWVISFSELTPERLIKSINPAILVKGGDYKVEQIAGSEHVKQHGGEVVIIPFQDGCSSSNIINAIKNGSRGESN